LSQIPYGIFSHHSTLLGLTAHVAQWQGCLHFSLDELISPFLPLPQCREVSDCHTLAKKGQHNFFSHGICCFQNPKTQQVFAPFFEVGGVRLNTLIFIRMGFPSTPLITGILTACICVIFLKFYRLFFPPPLMCMCLNKISSVSHFLIIHPTLHMLICGSQ
jgi:hypothetical protein